jgi:hypothetical protein
VSSAKKIRIRVRVGGAAVVVLTAALATSCAASTPDPRYQAVADQTAAQVVAYATQAAETARVQMIKDDLSLAERQKMSASLVQAANFVTFWSSLGISASICMFLFSTSLGGSVAVLKIGYALGRRAEETIIGAGPGDDLKSLPVLVRRFRDGSLLAMDPISKKTIAVSPDQVYIEEKYQDTIRIRVTGAIIASAANRLQTGVIETVRRGDV